MDYKVSIVIPTWNEASRLPSLLKGLLGLSPLPEIIVSDGNSTDETSQILKNSGISFSSMPRQRGGQLNAGARHAKGEFLLFLHADCELGQGPYSAMLEAFNEVDAGAFRFQLERTSSKNLWRFAIIEFFVHLRCKIFKLPYGDQGFFVRRAAFDRIGDFPDFPILEDVEWFRRLKRSGARIRILEAPLPTSGRRIDRQGWLRSAVVNFIVLSGYFFGISPRRLLKIYEWF